MKYICRYKTSCWLTIIWWITWLRRDWPVVWSQLLLKINTIDILTIRTGQMMTGWLLVTAVMGKWSAQVITHHINNIQGSSLYFPWGWLNICMNRWLSAKEREKTQLGLVWEHMQTWIFQLLPDLLNKMGSVVYFLCSEIQQCIIFFQANA